MSENFGAMDKAYFMSKNEIINWINSVLKVGITKIEQCATGAVYCQLLDAICPGTVNMKKVNWSASMETEFLANFKVLQQGLNACSIKKEIDIQKLAKGRYQDNFEFCQWFRGYYNQMNRQEFNYDAIQKRNGAVLTYLNPTIKGNGIMKASTVSSHFQTKAGGKIAEKPRPNKSHDHGNKENTMKTNLGKQLKTIPKKMNIAPLKQAQNVTNTIPEQTIPTTKPEVDLKMNFTTNPAPQITFEQIMEDPALKDKVMEFCNSQIEEKNKDIEQLQSINASNQEVINHKDEELIKAQNSLSTLTTENFNLKNDLENVKLTLADASTERDFYYSKLECIGFLCSRANSLNVSEFKSFVLKLIESPYDLDLTMKENDVPELIERKPGTNFEQKI